MDGMAADEPASLQSLDYTYHLDKVSCVREIYFLHVTLAYLVTLCGVMCLVCRAVPPLRPYHAVFGRGYILCMLWCMGTSILIHNTGLPIAVLISFVWVLGGLTAGWILIRIHHMYAEKEVLLLASETCRGGLEEALHNARVALASRSRTLYQAMVSCKAAHGMLMFVSFVNIAGRIFASNQSGDFTCHTYPIYKPAANQSGLVPEHDPRYSRLPWAALGLGGWGALLSLGPLLLAFAVGCAWHCAFSPPPAVEGPQRRFYYYYLGYTTVKF